MLTCFVVEIQNWTTKVNSPVYIVPPCISHDLRWNRRIDYVTNKANSTLGFFHHNISISNPERACKSLVCRSLNIVKQYGIPTHLEESLSLSQSSDEQQDTLSIDTTEQSV